MISPKRDFTSLGDTTGHAAVFTLRYDDHDFKVKVVCRCLSE